jgi:probable FeS assembly SUF system protein SufT
MSARYEEVTFLRDTEVVLVPDGIAHTVTEGTIGWITQVLGGNFTVQLTSGRLVRVNAADAPAIGQEAPPPSPEPARTPEGDLAPEAVWEVLHTCYDPEIPMDIVELGLVYGLELRKAEEGGVDVAIELTLTAPGCGMGQILKDDVDQKIRSLPGVHAVEVDLVFEPPWSPDLMSEAARLELGMF